MAMVAFHYLAIIWASVLLASWLAEKIAADGGAVVPAHGHVASKRGLAA